MRLRALRYVKVNADENADLLELFHVTSIPTMVCVSGWPSGQDYYWCKAKARVNERACRVY